MSGNGEKSENKVLIKLTISGDFEIWKFQFKNVHHNVKIVVGYLYRMIVIIG